VEGTKYVPITPEMVTEAFRKVKANGGSAGIDKESIKDFEFRLEENLYKIWNRLASGSYFPPAVKEVEIPKKDGKKRKLGIPTVGDRVAQTVIKDFIEPRLEAIFSNNSYGYRLQRSCHQALEQVRQNSWALAWVIDLDIKGFFDNIDHELLMLAIEKHVPEKWVKMYIKRWLEMPIVTVSGEIKYREGKGTPQGGVVSPILANLFLHYVLDMWLEKYYPTVRYVRYADDVIIHCSSKVEAESLLTALHQRMQDCKLELHPEKTKIAYCKQNHRNEEYDNISFDFLGYTFQPRESKNKRGQMFLGFDCGISIQNRTKLIEQISETNLQNASLVSIREIAHRLRPRIQGWLNYYGRFRKDCMRGIFFYLNERLVKWAGKRYRSMNKLQKYDWINRQVKVTPDLFPHWKAGFIGV
jgi:group II intron reverse transcriptase/maturase